MKRRQLTFVQPADKGIKITIKDGNCRLIGRHFDSTSTARLDYLGRRQLTMDDTSNLNDSIYNFDNTMETVRMESFERGDDVLLADELISHLHAMLFFKEQRLWISDMGSTNGTYVNGKKVGQFELSSGDVISLGNHKLMVE